MIAHAYSKRLKSESCSAILEYLIFGVAINVALLGFGVQILQVQKFQLAAESIARNSARSLAQSLEPANARAVAENIASSFELSIDDLSLNLECLPSDCSAPGSIAVAQVAIADARAQSAMPIEAKGNGEINEE